MMRRCVSELARRRRLDNVVSLVSVLRDGLLESILLLGLLCLILLSASQALSCISTRFVFVVCFVIFDRVT